MPYNRISAAGVQHGMLSDVDRANLDTARQQAQMAIMQEQMRRQQEGQDQASSDSRYSTDAMLASQGTFAQKAAASLQNENAQTQRYFGGLDRTMRPGMMQNELQQKQYQDQIAQRQALMDYVQQHKQVNVTPGTAGAVIAGPPAPGATPNMQHLNGEPDKLMLQIMAQGAGMGNINVPDAKREALQDAYMQAQIDELNRKKAAELPVNLPAIEQADPAAANDIRAKHGQPKVFTPFADVAAQDPDTSAASARLNEAMGAYGRGAIPDMPKPTGEIPGTPVGVGQGLYENAVRQREMQVLKQHNIFDAIHRLIQAAKKRGVDPREIITSQTEALRKTYGPSFMLPSWVTQ